MILFTNLHVSYFLRLLISCTAAAYYYGHLNEHLASAREDEISLFQELFIDKLLHEFGMEDCDSTLIPLDSGFDPNTDPEDNDTNPGYDNKFIKYNYQSNVGFL